MKSWRTILTTLAAVSGLLILFAIPPAQSDQGSSDRPTPAGEPSLAEGSANPSQQVTSDAAASATWTQVATGIDFREFNLSDPNNVFVARFDRANKDIALESSIGQGRLSGGLETVSSMASSYEQSISYWGQAWGGRNDVVVAINGSFFPGSGVPNRGVVHSGWYAKRHDDFENGSGFFWKLDRQAYVGECVQHVAANQSIENLTSGFDMKFQGINIDRGTDELVIYTPQFDTSTQTSSGGTEIVLSMSRPDVIIPAPGMALGTIMDIRKSQGDSSIAFDQLVLSGDGLQADKLASSANFQVGDQIGISQSIKHFEADCVTTQNSADWTKAFASVGGSFHFLKEGFIQSFSDPGANSPAPRTAIVFNDDYIYFIVVDGRDPGISEGMTMADLGLFSRDTLGALEGIAQDGGGSSTMVINDEVVNNTFCNNNFCSRRVYLPIVTGDGTGSARIMTTVDHQRAVANGMMMVMIEPADFSGTYSASQSIELTSSANLRLGPGINYGILDSFGSGTDGSILEHALNGIRATTEHWWYVSIGGKSGWIAEADFSSNP